MGIPMMDFIFEQIQTGGDRNFGYLIGDRKAKVCALIDPSYDPDGLVARAKAQGMETTLIINTHSHGDHTNGNERAKQLTQAPIAAYKTAPQAHEQPLDDNEEVKIGSLTLRMLHVPGHCPDHLLLYNPEYKVAITGDILFVGKVGGTAGEEAAREEWDSLQRIIKEIPGDTTIWPGHNFGCRPSSTINLEKATNPFLLATTFEEFYSLKEQWPQFKADHGLK